MNQHKTGMFTVLRDRDFLALWLSQLISKVGDNFAVVAALVLINELAVKSGLAVVFVAAASWITSLNQSRFPSSRSKSAEQPIILSFLFVDLELN